MQLNNNSKVDYHYYPDSLKDPKSGTRPNMKPLLHWGNQGIIRGLHFLDPLGGLGSTLDDDCYC